MGERIPWSDLPGELLEKIANGLDAETDFRRFRGVCSSWRSSTITPFRKSPPSLLKLPFPFAPSDKPRRSHRGAYLKLTEQTVYLLQRPEVEQNNCWIVKTERQQDGELRVLNPVSDRRIHDLHETILPKVLNTLEFRVFEIRKSYSLLYGNHVKRWHINQDRNYANKVAVSPSFDTDQFVVMAIDKDDKLWYIKLGEEKWTMVCPGFDTKFSDVVNYKGQFFAIDVLGGTWVLDSAFEATKITHNIDHPASRRHLVDLHDGELSLVEEVTDKDKRLCTCYDIDNGCQCVFPRTPLRNSNVEIIISRIDTPEREWVKVKKLDDQIIFVGDDCSFSVSAKQIKGFNGTLVFYADRCIFFRTEEKKKLCKHDIFHSLYHDNYDYESSYSECCGGESSIDEAGTVDNFSPNDSVKLKFREMHGHNIGVCDLETGKLG